MWPQALQMTRDECRGILRRLELESYSQVISVFRAQGGLSDAKAKLLEELRGIFHISNERHRAEARRVANDEQLATIAEAISGPNTWQEWSREGRRPYPMLPRVAPQTALALLANNVAEETAQENAKLPYPAETADAIKEEQQQIENQKSMDATVERSNYVVTNDPFKMPEIPNPKKNLKRNSEHQHSGTGKKRSMGDGATQQGHTQTTARKNYPHITANSPQTNSATSSNTVTGERKQSKQNAADPYAEKQRHFHRQQQLSKQKMAKKAAAAAAAAANNAAIPGATTPVKRQATPAKSGRRAKLQQEQQKQLAMKQLQMDMQQQQQQQFHQQQQPIPMQIDLTVPGAGVGGNTLPGPGQAIMTQQQLDMQFVTYATQHQPPQQIFMEKDIEMAHTTIPAAGAAIAAMPLTSSNPHTTSLITPLVSPQIAASKRDISKNLNKLQMQQQNQQQQHQQQQLSTNIVPSPIPSATNIPSHDLQTSLGNILSSSTTGDKNKSSEKTLISTTPVQKYIVEERQPCVAINLPQTPNPGTLVNLQPNPHGSTSTPTHIIQVSNAGGQQPQIMSFPQISAAATKLRAVNTTLIAPGTKITSNPTKKLNTGSTTTSVIGPTVASSINAGALHELANVASTQSQVLHIVDAAGAANNNNNNPTNVSHGTPLHTPPAVIQIHSTGAGATTPTSPEISAHSSQSKVLTTKILPLVLSGSGNQSNANSNLLNNSTLMMASSPTSSSTVSITSTSATVAGGTTTIIKNLSSNMVLNTSTANLTPVTVTSTNNPIISTLGAGGTVFRKPPNIIKTSVAATTPTKSTSPSSAPHIISNVKLTPVSVSPTSVGSHLTTTGSTFKNVLPSTSGMVRTSVKICQSPNGKVFIQPANIVDGSKMKLNTSTMPHKIISSTSANNSSATTSTGQRIAIQKVQIIPAPIGSSATGGTLQTTGNHINTKTGKGNMIFMPTSATNVRPVTLSKMGNNILLKSSANQALTPTSPTTTTLAATAASAAGDNSSIAKSNIVVLGPSPTTTPVKEAIKLENSQLINEDTPLDILNMPIVMEPGVGVASSSSSTAAETVTVLQSNIIDASNVSQSSALAAPIILDQTQLQPPSKTVVLNVDWEMKLDIEQQNQYNNKNLKQNKRTISSSSTGTVATAAAGSSTSSTTSIGIQQMSPCSPSNVIKPKHFNNDYISMELKSKETSNSSTTIVTTSSTSTVVTSSSITNPANNNNMIVIDDSFDDVIVEEHEDDASSVTSLDKHSKREQHNTDSDTPKILDMKIYQQHDGHDNRIAQQHNNEDIDIDVNDDDDDEDDVVGDLDGKERNQSSRQQFVSVLESIRTEMGEEQRDDQQNPQQHIESEIDAGFDETIVTEIDENTAIEYIEEDGASTNVSTTTTPTTTTATSAASTITPTILTKKNNIQQKTIATESANQANATTINSKTEDATKSSNTNSNNNLNTTDTSKEIVNTTSSSSENLNMETATTNATQETTTTTTVTKTANNSATQQVEP